MKSGKIVKDTFIKKLNYIIPWKQHPMNGRFMEVYPIGIFRFLQVKLIIFLPLLKDRGKIKNGGYD
jgi:hypothetical protein